MNERCEVCGFKMEPETGFYYGAMYAAYGLSVGFSIVVFLLYILFFPLDPIVYLAVNTILLFALFPLTFRWSRSLWLNVVYHYKPSDK